jgi:hypothetical protein
VANKKRKSVESDQPGLGLTPGRNCALRPGKELLQEVELLREEVKCERLSEGEILEDVPINEDVSDEALQEQVDTTAGTARTREPAQ